VTTRLILNAPMGFATCLFHDAAVDGGDGAGGCGSGLSGRLRAVSTVRTSQPAGTEPKTACPLWVGLPCSASRAGEGCCCYPGFVYGGVLLTDCRSNAVRASLGRMRALC
jgi:hypothetical protein